MGSNPIPRTKQPFLESDFWSIADRFEDPAEFSFAHGGKDGHPYPVDRETFDHSISTLKEAVEGAKLEKREKYDAIRRLKRYAGGDPRRW